MANDKRVMGYVVIVLFMIGTVDPISGVLVAAGSPLALGLYDIYPYLALVIAVMALGFALQDIFTR